MEQILLCVCGGIAAYKVCDLTSKLVQAGYQVQVAMTPQATQFVGALTFQALTARPVYLDLWHHLEAHDPQHIRLSQKADLIVIAPATAHTLGRLAQGLADDLVSTLLLAADPKKILAAPAMNEGMWNHPATVRNLAFLREIGVEMIGPESGWQACRSVGVGRMSESAQIFQAIQKRLGTSA